MKIYKFFKIFFMFIKHGINPFGAIEENKGKMIERLSEKDKKWLCDNAKGGAKYYLETMFGIERPL